MRPNENDSDWTTPDTAAETAITERPSALDVWRCDGEGAEPLSYATLTEASDARPASPEAMIAGGGVILAEAAQDICQWVFSDAGMRRLDQELAATSDRDSDVVLSVLLAQDFQLAVGS